jgi:hypothetical protein
MNQLSVPVSDALQAARPSDAPSARKALLVVGVSRSGTSVLSRLLHALGAAAPKTVMGAGHGNPMGHWEPQALVTLNDDILAGLGMRWSDPRPKPPEVRMILRDFDRFGVVLENLAGEDLRLTLRKSLCWRLIRPFYAMERLARRGLDQRDPETAPR